MKRTLAARLLTVFSGTLTVFGLVACGGTVERGPEGPDRLPTEADSVFPSYAMPTEELDESVKESTDLAAYGTFAVDDLVREVDRRLVARWNEGATDPDLYFCGPDEQAQRLAALSFLKPEGDSTGVPKDVIDALLREEGLTTQYRLLAAAYLERAGAIEERDAVLDDIFFGLYDGPRQTARAAAGPPGGDEHRIRPVTAALDHLEAALSRGEKAGFRLRDVAFTEEINALGDYRRLESYHFVAAQEALVYGEFVGFRERIDERQSDERVYCRKFTATLTLVDASGETVDSGTFLNAEQGTSVSKTPEKRLNFWAQYRFPADLTPGDYRLLIEATDLEGSERAQFELPLTILPPGWNRKPSPEP